MKWNIQKTAALGFLGAVIIVAVIGNTSWKSITLLLSTAERVQHTHRVLAGLDRLVANVVESETAQRGYLLTANENFLEPFALAEKQLPIALDNLEFLVVDNPVQARRIKRLQELVGQKLRFTHAMIELQRQGKADEAVQLVKNETGRRLMVQIRAEIAQAEAEEDALLETRNSAAQERAMNTLLVTGASTIANVALLLMMFFIIRRELALRKAVEIHLQKAHDLALESTRLKSEFLANMSHEIRTPMNGVLGMTSLLLGTPLDAAQRRYAETANSSAESLLTVINDILDFSKIEAGKLSFEMADFNLRNVVETVVELFGQTAQTKGVEIASLIYADVPSALKGDAGRLRQILVNFVGNAVKFTDKGEVIVRVRMLSRSNGSIKLQFSVTDTGIGISPEIQKKLFEPFTQADASTTRQFGGTGLGLAISKKLVERMHGEIGLKSEVGRGSEFWFTAEIEESGVNDKISSPIQLSGRRVLLVDDSETNRTILEAQLKSWGMEPQSTKTAEEALKVLESPDANFDALLIDMQMPGMNGLELGSQIARVRGNAKPPLIMLTSLGHQDEAALKQAGFNSWLTKPVRQSSLYECLMSVLHQASGTAARKAEKAKSHSIPNSRSFRILLAEDNRINQVVAQEMLGRLGLKADIEATGRGALKALKEKDYDVIFMDCQMPELDGYQTARDIRQAEAGSARHLHIIAMTAHAMAGDREKCLQSGMDDYLSKPISLKELEAALRRVPATENSGLPPFQLNSEIVNELRKLSSGETSGAWTEIITLFEEDAPPLVEQIRNGIDAKDFQIIAMATHKLGGSAGIFGAEELIGACYGLPAAAKSENWTEAERIFLELDIHFQRLLVALQKELEKTS